jgi:protein-S-isoprenylcysteine O-methyltransferase Ste14
MTYKLFIPMFTGVGIFLLSYIPIIAVRIRNEEKVLEEGLAGYTEYKKKVKYRLIPFIW